MILKADSSFAPLLSKGRGALPLPLGSPLRLPAAIQRTQAVSWASRPRTARPPELQDVVGGTDQRPFPADLPQAAQQELPEPTALLELAEHRLDDCFAPGLQASAPLGPQRPPHPLRHRQSSRRPAARGGGPGASVPLAIRRDEGLTAQGGQGFHVRLAARPRVHARGPRHLAGIDQHLGQERLGLLLVIGLIGALRRDHDLRRRIDGRLAVVPLDHTALRPRGGHDPALRIGEVTLGLRARH